MHGKTACGVFRKDDQHYVPRDVRRYPPKKAEMQTWDAFDIELSTSMTTASPLWSTWFHEVTSAAELDANRESL